MLNSGDFLQYTESGKRFLINTGSGKRFFLKGWLAVAGLRPLSLFISLLSMPKKAFDNVKIEK